MAVPGPSTTLRIDLECGSDPIRGTIGVPDGPTVPFTGWMELAGTLEAAHAARESDATDRGQSPDPWPSARQIRR